MDAKQVGYFINNHLAINVLLSTCKITKKTSIEAVVYTMVAIDEYRTNCKFYDSTKNYRLETYRGNELIGVAETW